MVSPARAFEYAFISHPTQQSVFENVFLHPGKSRGFAGENHLLAVERVQDGIDALGRKHRARMLIQIDHRPLPKHPPDYRSALEYQAVFRGQAIQAGLQQGGQGGRDVQRIQARQIDAPLAFFGQNHVVIDEHLEQLFDEVRHAIRLGGDHRAQ